ncbi:MAG: DALR domain-containing protein, partial [Eggerthellaceae bacterium]|nr:DALR domain-containing protein [Eggerthellaceae bacterium]
KMSKSLGNFLLLRDVLETTKPAVLRMLMIQTHYRSPLDFSEERLKESEAALDRIAGLVKRLDWAIGNAQDVESPIDAAFIEAGVRKLDDDFTASMDDDFNTAGALGSLFAFVADVNAQLGDKTVSKEDVDVLASARAKIVEIMDVFGVMLEAGEADCEYPQEVCDFAAELGVFEGSDPVAAVDALLQARADARKNRDFQLADKVRDGLTGMGFTIEDTPQGARVTFEAR